MIVYNGTKQIVNKKGCGTRNYITALFYFIDYLLQSPGELDKELKNVLLDYVRKEGVEQMQAEKPELSPTLAGILEELTEEEIIAFEESKKRKIKGEIAGFKKAQISIAKKLLEDGFSNEKIAELTDMELLEIINLRNSLRD